MAEVRLQPRVAWPREAKVGGRYLVEVDFEPLVPWPFTAEELAVHVRLKAGRALSARPLDRSVVLLHRFGGSYGAARFVLEAMSESAGTPLVLELRGPGAQRLGRVKLGPIVICAEEDEDEDNDDELVTSNIAEDPDPAPDDRRPIRVLHLSDTAFTADRHWEEDRILRPLAMDLRRMREEEGPPDLVCITGDVTKNGQLAEFERAMNWARVCLFEVLGVRPNQVFWLPGDRDEDRANPWSGAFRDALVRQEDTQAIHLAMRHHHPWVETRRQNWRRFLRDMRPDMQRPAWYSHAATRRIRHAQVRIIHLDSTWLSEDDTDQGELLIAAPNLRKYLRQTATADVVLALTHHPLTWLAPWQRALITGPLHDAAHLLLHGASKGSAPDLAHDEESRCLVATSGTLNPADPWRVAYQQYRIDPDLGVVDVDVHRLREGVFERDRPLHHAAVGTVVHPVMLTASLVGEAVEVVSDGGAVERFATGDILLDEERDSLDHPTPLEVLPPLPRGRPVVLRPGPGTVMLPWELLLRDDQGRPVLHRREGPTEQPSSHAHGAALVMGPSTSSSRLTEVARELLVASGRTVQDASARAGIQVAVIEGDLFSMHLEGERATAGVFAGEKGWDVASLAERLRGAELVLCQLTRGGSSTPWHELAMLGVALWDAGVHSAILGLRHDWGDDDAFIRLLSEFLEGRSSDEAVRAIRGLPGWWQWWGRADGRLRPPPPREASSDEPMFTGSNTDTPEVVHMVMPRVLFAGPAARDVFEALTGYRGDPSRLQVVRASETVTLEDGRHLRPIWWCLPEARGSLSVGIGPQEVRRRGRRRDALPQRRGRDLLIDLLGWHDIVVLDQRLRNALAHGVDGVPGTIRGPYVTVARSEEGWRVDNEVVSMPPEQAVLRRLAASRTSHWPVLAPSFLGMAIAHHEAGEDLAVREIEVLERAGVLIRTTDGAPLEPARLVDVGLQLLRETSAGDHPYFVIDREASAHSEEHLRYMEACAQRWAQAELGFVVELPAARAFVWTATVPRLPEPKTSAPVVALFEVEGAAEDEIWAVLRVRVLLDPRGAPVPSRRWACETRGNEHLGWEVFRDRRSQRSDETTTESMQRPDPGRVRIAVRASPPDTREVRRILREVPAALRAHFGRSRVRAAPDHVLAIGASPRMRVQAEAFERSLRAIGVQASVLSGSSAVERPTAMVWLAAPHDPNSPGYAVPKELERLAPEMRVFLVWLDGTGARDLPPVLRRAFEPLQDSARSVKLASVKDLDGALSRLVLWLWSVP